MAVLTQLLEWSTLHGIYIDRRLEIRHNPETGISVFSTTDIQKPTTLVRIPKTALLSVKSCAYSDHIHSEPCGFGAQLSLSLALYIELLLGEESEWFGYLESLPRDVVDLALFWGHDLGSGSTDVDGKEAMLWLKGTQVEKELTKDGQPILEQIVEYFYAVPSSLWSRLDRASPSLEGYLRAYSLVSSRAFLVDAYHGLSMVPIADAFNHAQENHVHLQADYDVCVICGSFDECSHDDEDGSPSRSFSSENTCEMVSNAPIFAEEQVFNTYGENLTNAQLLVQYGFIIDGNENDCVSWEVEELPWEVSSEIGGQLGVDSDGKVSRDLWDYCAAVAERWRGSRQLEITPGMPLACLCHSKRTRIGKDLKDASVVGDVLDSLPSHLTKTRMAIQLVLGELSLLESVQSNLINISESQI